MIDTGDCISLSPWGGVGAHRKRWRWVACGPDPPPAQTVDEVLQGLNHGVLELTHTAEGAGVLLVRVLREQLGDALAALGLAGISTLSTSGTARTLRRRLGLPSQRLAWLAFGESDISTETADE
ncbi:MAG TPA: hypothetical protein QF646_03795 [Candidatus Poseidoniales archaeon]|nr:hypothetical protein [Candidatus Poseidoniales archaeon]